MKFVPDKREHTEYPRPDPKEFISDPAKTVAQQKGNHDSG
jgi:hypothetical protein